MKQMVWLMAVAIGIISFWGCANNEKGEKSATAGHFAHRPANAVYHWKRVYDPNTYEKEFLMKHRVERMYLKFFDVGVDNLYDGKGNQPVPIATTIFKDPIRNIGDVEIVPVVFITVEALRLDDPYCQLADRIVERVDNMCWANHIPYKEIQLDCDWTQQTKKAFYELCHKVKMLLREKQKGLSATIRLHQLRDTLPDIDYGVLMLYNTESLQNPDVKNSILNSNVVKDYMLHAKADKHLDFAFPTYEWTLCFKDRKFMGILPAAGKTKVACTLRHETSDYQEIIASKLAIRPILKDIDYPSSTIIYHLDSANLSKYSDHEISNIYHH